MKALPKIAVWLAGIVVLSGCSTPCEGVCSSFNSCTVVERDHQVDCATFCSREQQFERDAAAAGAKTCKTEFDAHISCWQDNIKDICDAENTTCADSATAWTDCMAEFCAVEANATNQGCVVQDEGPALPALYGF